MSWRKVLREFDLSFDEGELQYIPDELIDVCACLVDYQPPVENGRYYAGLDSSSVGADWFCFAVLQDQGDRLDLVKLYRAKRRSMKRHLERIGAICTEYKIEAALVETNSFGQLYYESLSQEHKSIRWERFSASAGSNIRLLERMLMKMEEGKLAFPPDVNVTKELRALVEDPLTGKIEAAQSGSESEDGDNQNHDDIPRSLALAIQCFEQRPRKMLLDLSNLKIIPDQSTLNPTDPIESIEQ
jgi:Terminase RNaseH-like domain